VSEPADREELSRLAAESQEALDAVAGDPALAEQYVWELTRLAEFRRRLGETDMAVHLWEEAADLGSRLGSANATEAVTLSMFMLAAVASNQKRYREARGVIDRVIELYGIPQFEPSPDGPAVFVNAWLEVLEHLEDWDGLYRASGLVLETLVPDRSALQRATTGKALVRRAMSAERLGRSADEMLGLLQRALSEFDAMDEGEAKASEDTDWYRNRALGEIPGLLIKLGRKDEVPAAFARSSEVRGSHPANGAQRALGRVFGWARREATRRRD
jgi:tetratricopeptide (TPR) repeat protein